jgi:gluconolactonase
MVLAHPAARALRQLCFGGLKRNRLFMAASQSVYACYVNAQGVAGG